MTLLERFKLRVDEQNDMVLLDFLESAKSIIQNRRYPMRSEYPDEVEPKYRDLQLRIAVELYNKQGAEGQTSHSENGVARAYENAGVSESLLREITPKAELI